jgi:hypothetical protein
MMNHIIFKSEDKANSRKAFSIGNSAGDVGRFFSHEFAGAQKQGVSTLLQQDVSVMC